MEEKISKRTKWLHLRLNEEEYRKLQSLFKKTTEKNASKYARKVLMGEPVVRTYRNQSLDDIIAVLSRLQKDLNGIGNNYNQMVHKLHMLGKKDEYKLWIGCYEQERDQIVEMVREVRNYITQTAKKWLQ